MQRCRSYAAAPGRAFPRRGRGCAYRPLRNSFFRFLEETKAEGNTLNTSFIYLCACIIRGLGFIGFRVWGLVFGV